MGSAPETDIAPGTHKGRRLSNRERGVVYRARQRELEASLQQDVARLRGELDVLTRTRSHLLQSSVVARHATHGSLVELMTRYFSVLRHGFPDLLKPRSLYTRHSEQEIYVHQVLAPDVVIGSVTGIQGYIDQWRLLQSSFANITNEARRIEVLGPDHDPTVVVYSDLSARITEATFRHFFTRLDNNADLMGKLVGRDIVLPVTTRFYFTQDGKIREIDPELDYIAAFFNAGASTADLARLFEHSVLLNGYGYILQPRQAPAADETTAAQVPSLPPVPSSLVLSEARTGDLADLAALKNSCTSSGKRSSKRFRQRQREYERVLLDRIGTLKSHIAQLEWKRSAADEQALVTRNPSTRPLVKLVQTYFTLFKFGLTSNGTRGSSSSQRWSDDDEAARNQRCEAFLRQELAPNGTTGNLVGVDQTLAAWRAITAALTNLRIEIESLSVSGPEQDPVISMQAKYHATISLDTFRVMFPSITQENPIVAKLEGAAIVVSVAFKFQFTAAGQFLQTSVDMRLMEALMNAGATILEVAELMQNSVITPESTFYPSTLSDFL